MCVSEVLPCAMHHCIAHVALSMFQLLLADDSVTDGEIRKHEINSFAEVSSDKSKRFLFGYERCIYERDVWKCYRPAKTICNCKCGVTYRIWRNLCHVSLYHASYHRRSSSPCALAPTCCGRVAGASESDPRRRPLPGQMLQEKTPLRDESWTGKMWREIYTLTIFDIYSRICARKED